MRIFSLAVLALAPIVVTAQTLTAAERVNVGWALSRIGSYGTLTIICDGEQQLGNNLKDLFRIELMADFTNAGSPKLAAHEFLNGRMISKTVGDGVKLWTYGVQSNAYSTSTYGENVPTGQTKSKYLLKQLSGSSKGQLTQLAQLLNDIFNPTPDAWMPFMPAAQFVEGRFENPSKSKIESMYYMYDPEAKVPTVTEVGYQLKEMRLGSERRIKWKADLLAGGLPNLSVFEFVPPPGAVAVRAKN